MNDGRQELLIARIVAGEARDRDWDELFAHAAADPRVWRRVVESQRDQAGLVTLMTRAQEIADAVDVDPDDAAFDGPVIEIPSRRMLRLVGSWRGWAGWAIAAALFLSWSVSLSLRSDPGRPPGFVQTAGPIASPTPPVQQATILPIGTAREAFQAYLDKGREEGTVLSTVPRRVLLETRPNPNGDGFELIFIQQVMERAVVPHLFQVQGLDERGRPTLAKYKPRPGGRM